VSRPYLIKHLEDGRIPFAKTGAYRRIWWNDVMVYKERRDSERRRGLAELAQHSQEFVEDE
jgi:excisionase family DNA binding protein